MSQKMPSRRDFIQQSTVIAAAACGASTILSASADAAGPVKKEKIRVGFVGVGVKGWQHMLNLLHIEGVEMAAVCDVREEPCRRTQRTCEKLGMPQPTVYTGGEYEFQRMCDAEDLDLVYTATPWRWHVPVCLAALKTGSHAATEIPAALTIEDCWNLVDACEKTGRHLSMMENVNYRRDEMAIWNMVRKGLLGELVHAEGAYAHDTRYLKIRPYGDGLWLGKHHADRNGNLYPTHGLGPIAWYMNLGRGNRMEYLVSMSSPARGMNLYAKEHLPEGHPDRERDYINGDVNICLIKTSQGQTITIKHDTDLPRPYSRTNLVQGTRGIVRGAPRFLVSLEDRDLVEGINDPSHPNPHKGPHHKYNWQDGGRYADEYEHPLTTFLQELAAKTPVAADGFDLSKEIRSGDYLEDYRLIQAHRQGIAPDFDVYDAVAWSAVAPLSEKSVAERSAAVDFPDFTRGKWKNRKPLRIMGV